MLQQSFVGKTKIASLGYDQVVNDRDLHQCSSLFQLAGNFFVGIAGFQIAGGMIVSKYQGSGMLFKGKFQYQPHIDHSPRHSTLTQSLLVYHLVLSVEEKHPELFVGEVADFRPQKVGGILASLDLTIFESLRLVSPPAQFHGSNQGNRLCLSNTPEPL